jgi:acyl transferase domain-containing protein
MNPQFSQFKLATKGMWLKSLSHRGEDWQQILNCLLQLYIKGVSINWSSVERDYSRRKITLPTYPFQRQRYWLETT